ncbi:unnamed protein product [Brassicogethes aeneus]|uniref:Uncharacterized protein n=1 Tax=Brassicogethes aeneus TaxID=1431903 RepID=A0A9P0B4Y6_BRAAE|nr:unnamed protein product [Brassicogethes aeneus]
MGKAAVDIHIKTPKHKRFEKALQQNKKLTICILLHKWIIAIGRPDLLPRGKAIIRKNYRVCDKHFSEKSKFPAYKNRTNLKYRSVPDLLVKGLQNTKDEPEQEFDTFIPTPMECSPTEESELSAMPGSSLQNSVTNTSKTLKPVRISNPRSSLLKSLNITRKAMLSPKAHKLYEISASLKKYARRLKQKNEDNKDRIKEALKFAQSPEYLQTFLNKTTYNFVMSQLNSQNKKSRGRRFSLEDKIFALSLLKQSPKGYRLLKKTFALPSRRTLMRVLNKVPFSQGLNMAILNSLKTAIAQMKPLETYCIFLFDEMSIEPSLHFNESNDTIEGFQYGTKTPKIADHVMVFMARGIYKKWKQPIAYFFTEHGMSAVDLAYNIKSIISALQNIGLNVVATACDQMSTNIKAIKLLEEETRTSFLNTGDENKYMGFCVEKKEIVPLFDFPHLLKGVRNNLLNRPATFIWKGEEETSCWEDIIKIFEIDVGDSDFKMLNKITEQHVYPAKIKKMKVKNAAQVFSHRMSSTMRGIYRLAPGVLPESSLGTANFLLFFDKLFDSVNGSKMQPEAGKELRCGVTKESEHKKFWEEALTVLKTIKFKKGGSSYVPPTIRNWIWSIKNLIYLWEKLNSLGFKYLCPRNLNQDPAMILNNFMTSHSPGANCEEDDSEGALSHLLEFLDADLPQNIVEKSVEPVLNTTKFNFNESPTLALQTNAYIAGYMAKKFFKQIGNCGICKSLLVSENKEITNFHIREREFHSNALLKPRTHFTKLFSQCVQDSKKSMIKRLMESKIVDGLEKSEIKLSKCRGQGYDGAATMSGIYNGVQKKILDREEKAIYVHCAEHRLNLVLNDASTGAIPEVQRFWELIEQIYVFFANSIKRRLCPTRWSSRNDSLQAVAFRYCDILKALSKIILISNSKTERNEAIYIRKEMENFEFVLQVVMHTKVLTTTNLVTKALQRPDVDLSHANVLLERAYQELRVFRNDYEGAKTKAVKLSAAWGVKSLKDVIKTFRVLQPEELTKMTDQELFKEAVKLEDTYAEDIGDRFPEQLISLRSCLKKRIEKLSSVKQLADLLIVENAALSTSFQEVCTAVILFLTIPVTVATAERSFSKLKIIKTYLRSTMGQEHLSCLSILSIEHKIANRLRSNLDQIIRKFADAKVRRIKF